MAEVSTNDFVRNLEKVNGLRRGTLSTKGFGPFLGRKVTDLDERDSQIVFDSLQFYLTKSIGASERRHARRVQSRGPVLYTRGPVLYKRDVERALLLASRDLLAKESGLSRNAREFIKDHCPCE